MLDYQAKKDGGLVSDRISAAELEEAGSLNFDTTSVDKQMRRLQKRIYSKPVKQSETGKKKHRDPLAYRPED